MSVLTALLATVASCAPAAHHDADSPCSSYTAWAPAARQQAAAAVSAARHTGDAGNPMTYLNADECCAQHPAATLGDAVGTSLEQYRATQAEQSAVASAAAAPTKTTITNASSYALEVTHLCASGQTTAKLVLATTNLTTSSLTVRGAAEPVTVPAGNPSSSQEQQDFRLITVACPSAGNPTKLSFADTDYMSSVAVTFPDSAGQILTSNHPGKNYASILFNDDDSSPAKGKSVVTIIS